MSAWDELDLSGQASRRRKQGNLNTGEFVSNEPCTYRKDDLLAGGAPPSNLGPRSSPGRRIKPPIDREALAAV